jgi:hypothetical protein
VPGAGLLRVVQRFMQASMTMARRVTWIAQQKLMGEDLSRLAPAGFDATATHHLVLAAAAWTAALRARLRAQQAGQPVGPLVPPVPKSPRAPHGRGRPQLVTVMYGQAPGDPHDWPALAKPWRIGPTGVAAALQLIADMSNRQVVSEICNNLRKAVVQLGAAADLPRIAALEAAARALCPEASASESGGRADGASRPRAAHPSDDEPVDGADDDPPCEPPD